MQNNDKRPHTPPSLNINALIQKANERYEEIKSIIEPANNGKYLALEVTSGEYSIGNTREEAVSEIKKKYPKTIPLTRKIGEIERASRHLSRSRLQYAI